MTVGSAALIEKVLKAMIVDTITKDCMARDMIKNLDNWIYDNLQMTICDNGIYTKDAVREWRWVKRGHDRHCHCSMKNFPHDQLLQPDLQIFSLI